MLEEGSLRLGRGLVSAEICFGGMVEIMGKWIYPAFHSRSARAKDD